MITPINGHLLIEPIVKTGFVVSAEDKYQEIGVVISIDPNLAHLNAGDKVYFDSWLAAKFPGEKEGEFYWLIKYEDVRAVEYAEPQ